MKRILTLSAAALAVIAVTGAAMAQYGDTKQKDEGDGEKQKHVAIDHAAPNFKLMDQNGKAYQLSEFKGKYVVLEWTNMGCPFVRKHYDSGNMQSLQKTFTEKGVVWLTICSSGPGKEGNLDAAGVTKWSSESKSMRTAYLLDENGDVGRIYGAKTTPHMFVINPEGAIIYAGAIDDKPSTKQADIKGADNYVADCLNSAMAGKEVATKTSQPYGCSVKYASKTKTDT